MKTDALSGLIALKAVADKKNFTAAANELRISPSAVSQAIKQLESRLGVALLSRTTRSTNLTEAGRQFLGQCGPALTQILSAIEHVGTFAGKPSGLLRLNLPRVAYPIVIAPILADFKKVFPEITVELFFDDNLADVVTGGFDAGIRMSELMAKDMAVVRLSPPFRFVVAGAPAYFKKFGKPKHPQDLLSHPCIYFRFGNGQYYKRWEFEEKKKAFGVETTGSLIINDSLLMIDAAVQGLGLTYHGDNVLAPYVKQGKLQLVLEDFAPKSDGFFLYYPNRAQVPPKLRAFIDFIKARQR